MSDLVVSTAFTAEGDAVSAALVRQAKAADTFGGRAKAAFAAATKGSSLFKSVLGANLMSKAITTATSAMTRGMRTVISEFVSFDDAIGQAAAKMPGQIGRGTDAFKELETAARTVGASTKYTATEAAEGLNFLAMAGFDAAQSMAALPAVTSLATATGMDLARATDIASDALGAFNLMTKDASGLELNLARINDVFAKTTNTANVDMENMFETMKNGGPVMTAAGQSIETFAALTGKLGSAGLKGSDAGTVLKNMMLQLQGPSAGASKALKTLGVEVADSDGNMRDIIDILGDYTAATKGMGEVQRNATTDLIFGKRAVAGVSILMAEGSDSLREYRDSLEKAGGTAADMAKEIEKSMGNKLKSLQSAAIELGFQLLEAFAGDGKEGIDNLIKAVREFDMKPIIAGAKDLLAAFKWLFGFLRDHTGTIKSVGAAFIVIKTALATMSFVNAITGFGKMTAAANAAATASKGAAAAGGGVGGAASGASKLTAGNAAVPAVAAAAAGYSIGTLIEESIFDPQRKQAEAYATRLNNMATKAQAVDTGAMSVSQLQSAMKQMETMGNASSWTKNPIKSIEGAFEFAGQTITQEASRVANFLGIIDDNEFTRVREEYKTAYQVQAEQMNQLNRLYLEMSAALVKAKADVERSAKQAVDVNIDVNAPDGTKVSAKSSSGGAKVDQSKAGKS